MGDREPAAAKAAAVDSSDRKKLNREASSKGEKSGLKQTPSNAKTSGAPIRPPDASQEANDVVEGEAHPDLDEQLANLEIEEHSEDEPVPSYTDGPLTEEPNNMQSSSQSQQQKPNKLRSAWSDVKHFAGGLITHPYEATKHFTILRHSHGLVYYQGPKTNIAITIFTSRPLPANRKLWLQKRGFSGKTGLKVGATLGTRSAWIDVTPAADLSAEFLPPDDERAWQRDIHKFTRKAASSKNKNIRNQTPYETDVVRIPHVAEEGYFRIVLCVGRKVLCPSPMFRYVSASTDPSVLRGASLKTLPLEVGVRVGAIVANEAANGAAHGALQPVTNAYQNQVQPLVEKVNPAGATQEAALYAYEESGAAERVAVAAGEVDERYEAQQEAQERALTGDDASSAAQPLGSNEGPSPPYPLLLSGKVIQRTGKSSRFLQFPTADLAGVPSDQLRRLEGVYLGWTQISKTQNSTLPPEVLEQWHPSIITVAPALDQRTKALTPKNISVHIITTSSAAGSLTNPQLPTFPPQTTFFNTSLTLLILTYLRPTAPLLPLPSLTDPEIQHRKSQHAADVAQTLATLAAERTGSANWHARGVLEKMRRERGERSWTEKVADVSLAGKNVVGRRTGPVVRGLGVKREGDGVWEEAVGRGGVRVAR
ncbi:hypothetical protein D0862_15236 [Hortaea werneckii]|uniref:Riboflavin kinase n=1 Tax=Hortaea werneckii TaxID=91943 RepID=A0A3M7DP73_HORWE|nr:hypothetical protein D0862_15236 [Hortaea werneckii]